MTNSLTTGPHHLTFDQVGDLAEWSGDGWDEVHPCECWLAGYGVDYVYDEKPTHYQHPEEFIKGVQSRFEEENDL